MVFLLTVMPARSRISEASLPVMLMRAQIDEHEVVVGAAADEAVAVMDELGGEGLGVDDDLALVLLEAGLQRLVEADGLCGDDVHERAALDAGEDLGVDGLCVLLAADDDAAARAAQALVRGGGDEIGVGRPGLGCTPRGDEAGDVRHIDEKQGARRRRRSRAGGEIDDARDRRRRRR